MRFMPPHGGGVGDRIRPFETRLGASMPGPAAPSFVHASMDDVQSQLRQADVVDAYHDQAADKYAAGDFDRAEQLYLMVVIHFAHVSGTRKQSSTHFT